MGVPHCSRPFSFAKLASSLALAVAFVGGTLSATGAQAASSKTIQLRLHNTSSSTPMSCSVSRILTNSAGRDVSTVLRRFSVSPKNDRPESQRSQPQNFSMSVKATGRRYDRSAVYPRLQLRCSLEGNPNSANHSPEWNDREKPLSNYRFYGGCRSGAVCSVRVERK